MNKLINKFLFWWHREAITEFIDFFFLSDMQTRVMPADKLNIELLEKKWSADKTRRVIYLVMYFGIVEECNHPHFKKRLCYRLTKKFTGNAR